MREQNTGSEAPPSGRKPGSGGGYCRDGVTLKNPKRFTADEAKDRAAVAKRKKIEATVSTRISNELDAAWIKLGKPEGALNRWLEKLAWAALKAERLAASIIGLLLGSRQCLLLQSDCSIHE